MAKSDKRGRSSSGGRFVALHLFLIQTPAWAFLSAQDRSVYLSVAMLYDGRNNGFLGRSVRQAAELANVNKDTASRSLTKLVNVGFLECVTPGGFSRKTRHAAEWRLTQYRCDKTNEPGSKAFMKWRPVTEKPDTQIQTTVPN